MSYQVSLPEHDLDIESVKVLLVEDEPRVRRVMKEVLEAQGYAVLECDSAEQALSQTSAASVHTDVLLTDVMLPAKSGRQLALDLRARIPGLKTILVSGYGEAVAFLGMEEMDAISYLPKPFSAASLARAVRNAVEGVNEWDRKVG